MAKWIIDPDHSSVAFSIRHMMIAYIRGQFKRPADCGLDRQRQDRPEQTDDPGVASMLAGIEPLDRTTINAWEDREFVAAVRATGRKKMIMTALWTEACLTFPSLDAMREGYEVYPVVDAVGGTSVEAHRAALERVIGAGAKPVTWVQVICELQRDWNRTETVKPFVEILFDPRVAFIAAERAAA